MNIQDEFKRVCRLAGLIEIKNAPIPTWKTHDGLEAIELKKDKLLTFWFKDGQRIYDQPIGSSKITLAIQAFEEKPKDINEVNNEYKKTEKQSTETRKDTSKTILSETSVKREFDKVETGVIKAQPETIKFFQNNEEKRHNELVIGSVSALAGSYGISKELADLFFMKFDNQIYIKNPGLLYLAAKKGYGHMLVTDKFDETTKEWVAEYRIYPILTKEVIESISKLNPAIQEQAMINVTMPTNGIGRASSATIKMKTMLQFARELAQTRAQNRALRAYTGYGGCSAEELE
jgi:hypothetical protein